MARRRHKRESGFALLLVFLMAAVIAITLYVEIPRVAFEAQRQKEQLLMARGEQYKRAIQLYFRATKRTRYPADLDDLERGLNNMRFLRHRYKDPMTGKDEWRLIHIQNGMLTDSKVANGSLAQKQETGGSTGAISAVGGISDLQTPGQGQAVSALNRRRASEGGPGGGLVLGPDGQPVQNPGGQPGAPVDPNATGAQPGTGGPGVPGVPGQPGDPNATASGTPPTGAPGQPSGLPGQPPPFPGMPGAPVSSQTGGVSPQPISPYSTVSQGQGSPPPYPQPGMQVNPQQQSAAQNLISGLLTSPRPGGMTGLNQGQGQVMGGGLVGIASTVDAEGIMVYNDRTNYSEWEFIYDVTKDRGVPNLLTGPIGTPASSLGTLPPGQQAAPGVSVDPGIRGGNK